MLVILMAAISIARASLYSGAEEVGFYCQVFIPFHGSKERVRVPKWMNLRKFQTAFAPSFSENCIAFSPKKPR